MKDQEQPTKELPIVPIEFRRIEWREKIIGIIMVLLALVIVILVLSYSIFVLIYGRALDPPASTTVSVTAGGIIGILGAYVGRKI